MKIKQWNDNWLEFDNGACILGESSEDMAYNWIDFDASLNYNIDNVIEFDYFSIRPDEDGFMLILHGAPHKRLGAYDKKIWVPCYSEQTGAYSNELKISFTGAGRSHKDEGKIFLDCFM